MKFKASQPVYINHRLYKTGTVLNISRIQSISLRGMIPMDAAAKEGYQKVLDARAEQAKKEGNDLAVKRYKEWTLPVDPDVRRSLRIPGMKFNVKPEDNDPNRPIDGDEPVDIDTVQVEQPQKKRGPGRPPKEENVI